MSSKCIPWTARAALFAASLLTLLATSAPARADESSLVLPDLASVQFMGTDGRTLLMAGMGVSVLGLVFGIMIYMQLKRLPVHRAMLEISELIYATCKTYLITQIKFILMLEALIGAIMVVYFGVLRHLTPARSSSSWSAASSASRDPRAWPGSGCASTPSRTAARRSRPSRESPSRRTRSRSRPA